METKHNWYMWNADFQEEMNNLSVLEMVALLRANWEVNKNTIVAESREDQPWCLKIQSYDGTITIAKAQF